jgi:uncharacterized integral membrane protein
MPQEPNGLDTPDVVVPPQGQALRVAQEPPEPDTTAQDVTPDAPAKPNHHTRISALWVAIGGFGVLLLFALLFVLQNDHSVDITFFGMHGHMPLGVALLLAGICGGVLVVLVGTARILQLRAVTRRQHQQLRAKS